MKCGECGYLRSNMCPGVMRGEDSTACQPAEDSHAAHARVAELEAERDRLVTQHMDCTALEERDEARAAVARLGKNECALLNEVKLLKAEAAKRERAARTMAHVLGTYSQRIADGKDIKDTLRTEEAWLRMALEDDAPQAQEEEKT